MEGKWERRYRKYYENRIGIVGNYPQLEENLRQSNESFSSK